MMQVCVCAIAAQAHECVRQDTDYRLVSGLPVIRPVSVNRGLDAIPKHLAS
jgi:hypothetical protein